MQYCPKGPGRRPFLRSIFNFSLESSAEDLLLPQRVVTWEIWPFLSQATTWPFLALLSSTSKIKSAIFIRWIFDILTSTALLLPFLASVKVRRPSQMCTWTCSLKKNGKDNQAFLFSQHHTVDYFCLFHAHWKNGLNFHVSQLTVCCHWALLQQNWADGSDLTPMLAKNTTFFMRRKTAA